MSELQGIARLFDILAVRYAAAWRAKWDGLDMRAVQADWSNVLAGLSRDQLQHGATHLPPIYPPNAGEFRAVCLAAPQFIAPALPDETRKPDRPRLAAELTRLRELLKNRKSRQWREDLEARRAAGEQLSPAQLHSLSTPMLSDEPQHDESLLAAQKRAISARVEAYARQHDIDLQASLVRPR